MIKGALPTKEQLDERMDKDSHPRGCWVWMSTLDKLGRAVCNINYKVRRAHRCVWEVYVSPIPEGKQCLHHCDNKYCVNPEHLYIGTHTDNMRDIWKRKPIDRHGERAPKSKLKDSQVRYIRWKKGAMTGKQLAQQFGITHQSVYDIWNRKTWTHI